MKVVIAADIYPPDIGGPATYSEKLKEDLPKRGVEVGLVCYSDRPGTDVIRVVRSGNTLVRYFKYYKILKKAAATADVIYAMGPVSAGLPAMWAAKKLKKPLVVKVVGDYAWEQARNNGLTDIGIDLFQNQDFGGKIGKLQKVERQVCQFASKVITPSQYLKKIVVGWGISADKVEVVYNAQAIESIKVDRLPGLVVSVGRLVPWKGFDTLITTIAGLPELKLKIFGSGPEKQKLEDLIKKLDLNQRVSIEEIEHKNLISFLAQAEIFVLNTGYEGLPHAILEAIAVGTPVITTRVGGNPEVITDGQTGLLIEYNNQEQLKRMILALHNDKSLQGKLSANAKNVLNQFDYEKMFNETISLLKSV